MNSLKKFNRIFKNIIAYDGLQYDCKQKSVALFWCRLWKSDDDTAQNIIYAAIFSKQNSNKIAKADSPQNTQSAFQIFYYKGK